VHQIFYSANALTPSTSRLVAPVIGASPRQQAQSADAAARALVRWPPEDPMARLDPRLPAKRGILMAKSLIGEQRECSGPLAPSDEQPRSSPCNVWRRHESS